MQRYKAVIALILWAFVVFAVSWTVYPWLLDTLSGNLLFSSDIDGLIAHQLLTSGSFVLLGVVLGIVLFIKVVSPLVRIGMVLIAIATLGATWMFLKKQIGEIEVGILNDHLLGPHIYLPIDGIKMYLMGIIPSCAVAICAIVLFLTNRIHSHTSGDHP
jgi:hypothetical protein